MLTIRDVAAHAGVSVATVSRWLSGQNVHAADAVRRAVEELDYRPNVSARSLRTGHRGVIGVIVPDITNPFFASIVKGQKKADHVRVMVVPGSARVRGMMVTPRPALT